MKTRTPLVLSIILLCCIGGFTVYSWLTKPKIAFVYNNKVLEKFDGVKDSRRLYQEKEQSYRSNIDTLEKELGFLVRDFQQNYGSYNAEVRKSKEDQLRQKQADFYQYKAAAENEIAKENEKLTVAVLNQINEFIVDYSKTNKYDFVFGTTTDGSLFYSKECYDITEEVIQAMNSKYRGEK
jgi:outer membrane protein